MEENVFKIGVTVVLKSGGPDMTIDKFIWDEINGQPSYKIITCIWFDGNNLNKADFNKDSLDVK